MTHRRERIFGTDGIRGIANLHPMTPEISLKLGKALVSVLRHQKSDESKLKVVIGKDTRLSGYIFEQAISAGIASMGADVLLVGPLPTPAVAFLTTNMRADAGVVISASHNPFEDNGIKLFDRSGYKLPDEKELEIEELIQSDRIDDLRVRGTEIGKSFRVDDAQGRYVVFIKNTFPKDLTLDGIKIVLDCANGASYKVSPLVFQELGADLITVGVSPDGRNINTDCGSLNPELLRQKVLETRAEIGIAVDGDADRVVFCDETGNVVDGDKIIAVLADEMISSGSLSRNTVVATIMSNMALEIFLKDRGCNLVRTQVGDRYVVEEMRRRGCDFGGEKSGHLIFLNHGTTGDGTLAALQILSIIRSTGKSLSDLTKIIDLFPQLLINVRVKEKRPFSDIPMVTELVTSKVKQFNGQIKINLRYSGTEPVARIMVEGEDEVIVRQTAEEVASEIDRHIGTG